MLTDGRSAEDIRGEKLAVGYMEHMIMTGASLSDGAAAEGRPTFSPE